MRHYQMKEGARSYGYASVAHGHRARTAGGLIRSELKQNKDGKWVSKKKSQHGKEAFKKNLQPWAKAVSEARHVVGAEGFVPLKKGGALYDTAKEIHGGKTSRKKTESNRRAPSRKRSKSQSRKH